MAYLGGAEHLAKIHGTEEDRVNCPFYFKIGACRHGDRCSRQHHKPPFSQTIIVRNMWNNPYAAISNVGGDPAQLPAQAVQDEVLL
jgi:splicing factor U2AF 35 kDa subunit